MQFGKELATGYYIGGIILSAAFFFVKITSGLCTLVFGKEDECGLDRVSFRGHVRFLAFLKCAFYYFHCLRFSHNIFQFIVLLLAVFSWALNMKFPNYANWIECKWQITKQMHLQDKILVEDVSDYDISLPLNLSL